MKGKKIQAFCSAVFLAGLICSGAGCGNSGKLEAGNIAPDFTLNNLYGEKMGLKDFTGRKIVFLVFGASWCPYCREEVGMLKAIQAKYFDTPVMLLYINISESAEKTSAYAREMEMTYPVLVDTGGTVAKLYKVRGIPHNVIVDSHGVIRFIGMNNQEGYEAVLDQLVLDLNKEKGCQ